MAESLYYFVDDVAGLLEISVSHAYKVIRRLNNELEQRGKIIFSGRVSKAYFHERFDYIPNQTTVKRSTKRAAANVS